MTAPEKIKILIIFGNVAWMGQERANVYVIDCLNRTGRIDSLFLVNDRGYQWHIKSRLEVAGLAYFPIRFPWNLSRTSGVSKWLRTLWEALLANIQFLMRWRKYRPDFIHVGNSFQAIILLPSLLVVRTPIVFRLGDVPEGRTLIERWLWRVLAVRVDYFVCNAKFVLKKLLSVSDVSEKTRVIYNFPPTRLPTSVLQPTNLVRTTDVLTFVYFGSISKMKGVDILVEAAVRFLNEHDDVRFIVAGPVYPVEHHSFAWSLIDKVRELKLESKILFVGMVEDISALLSCCDVHLCPSNCEEAGANVIFESKAAGIPSVIFPSGALPELVEHAVDGFICSDLTSDALVEGLKYFYLSPAKSRSLGLAAFSSLKRLEATEADFNMKWLRVYGIGANDVELNK